ncbi:MAG: methylated-DNA--[protein]-cysteine S-methyltransferase [Chloroflexota bacterium]|nr:methylated-DNA--[protein]-cysteine S-methyltransferase [Chloroflexota bacterium]
MSASIAYTWINSPVGPVWVATTETGVCTVGLGTGQPEAFFDWLDRHVGSELPHEDSTALAPAPTQLREYFYRIRREFGLALDVRGKAFQRAVWAEVARIPYGATTTYGKIAQRMGRPRAARAVGAAVGANPLPILIPCHRVLGAGGSLTGYGGGLEVKAALLRLEGVLREDVKRDV